MKVFFANHEIAIYRTRRKGSSDRYGMSATFTALSVDLQPASQERTEFVNGRIGATFTGFIDTTYDIKESDQVHVIGGTYNGKVFSVKGVQHWEGAGFLDHIELTMVAQDA